jgi:hypothetical protein
MNNRLDHTMKEEAIAKSLNLTRVTAEIQEEPQQIEIVHRHI